MFEKSDLDRFKSLSMRYQTLRSRETAMSVIVNMLIKADEDFNEYKKDLASIQALEKMYKAEYAAAPPTRHSYERELEALRVQQNEFEKSINDLMCRLKNYLPDDYDDEKEV